MCCTGTCEQDHGVLCSTSHHCCKEEEREEMVRAAFPAITPCAGAGWECPQLLRDSRSHRPQGLLATGNPILNNSCVFFSCVVSPAAQQSWWSSTSSPNSAVLSWFLQPCRPLPFRRAEDQPPVTREQDISRVFCKGREVQREFEGLTFGSWSLRELSRSGEGCAGSREQQSGVMSKRGMELGVARMGQGQGVPARMQ